MVEINFIPLDYDSFDYEGRNYVKLMGRNNDGKRICVIDTCDIYFWAILKDDISEKKAVEFMKKIENIKVDSKSRITSVIKTELHKKKLMGKDVRAIKIFITNNKDCKDVADMLNYKIIDKSRECDINFLKRYILEKKIIPLDYYKVNGEILNNSEEFDGIDSSLDVDFCIKADKIESIKKFELFHPKVLAFDIETEEFEIGKGEIFMISLVSGNFKKVLSCKKSDKKQDFVEYFKNEKDMLEAFVCYVKKISPDILTGYFSDGFDLPYLKSRAEKNKVKLSLGIDGSSPKFSGGMNPRGKISGIVHIDLYQFIRTAYSQYLQSETLGLNEVASELLEDKKIEYEFKPASKMDHNDWFKFFEYNLHDSVLTYKLFEKVWPDIAEFAKIMHESIFEVSRNGMSANVESYIINNLEKYNEIIEKKPTNDSISERREREKYEGAFVLQPVPKLYENIAMFDFTSYWPSIISTFNLSSSTFLGSKKTLNSKEIEISVGGKKKKVYFSKKKGFFPEMLEEIINFRRKYKEEYKKNPSPIFKARSNAFKLLANASYGYQGFFGARYYCPEASAATTAISREFIKKIIEESKASGFNPIYSDTDSIAIELGEQTQTQTNDFLKKINSKLPGIMELELEDFYSRGIWVTTRKGEEGAKKKYALINEKGKIKIRGFETVRRDWCGLARDLQNKILVKILKEGDEKSSFEYLKKIITELKERKIEKNKLIIRTQLKKSLSDYKAITPHVTIAKKCLKIISLLIGEC